MPKRRFSQFLLIALVASLLLSALPFSEGAGDFWMTKAAMPTARTDFQVGVVNGKIYAIGGYNNGTSLAVNEEYDPKTDTWTTKAPMPTARNGFAMFVFENKIHIVGGVIYPVHEFTLAHEVYDPATNTWETKSPASAIGVGVGFEANVVNGKAYLISGGASLWRPWPNTDGNEVYDPLTDEWLTKEPIPTGVFVYASAVAEKKIYIMGGRDVSKNVTYDLTQIYDTETDTWSLGASVPTGLSGAGGATTTGAMAPKRIYFIGGYTCVGGGGMFFSESHNLNQIYDPEKDEWSTGARMLTSRSDFGLAVVDDVLYAIGGYDGENYLNVNEQYTPSYGTSDPSSPSPSPEAQDQEPFPTVLVATASAASAAIIGIGLVVYFRKRKH